MNSDTGGVATVDYMSLCEGDVDPNLRKKIRTLIAAGDDYIVYLDQDLYVEWSFDTPRMPELGKVLNEVSHLETLSSVQLDSRHMEAFRRLLGESVARLIADSDPRAAEAILERATEFLRSRSLERARMWYLTGAGVVTGLALAALLSVWGLRDALTSSLGQGALDVMIAAGFGAIGAFTSILLRTTHISMDPAAGSRVHYVESGARILTGIIGALLLSLAIKANLILGDLASFERPLIALIVLSMVAGASERVLPGLIREVEGMLPNTGTNSALPPENTARRLDSRMNSTR